MATRFRGEFTDDSGQEWRVDVLDNTFSGTVETIPMQSPGFTIEWNGGEDKHAPILASSVQAHFLINEAGDQSLHTLLASQDEGRFALGIYTVSGGTPTLWWCGTILTDLIELDDDYFPYPMTVTAGDELGLMTEVDYDNDGTAYADNVTTIGHVHRALLKARHVGEFFSASNAFLRYADDFFSSDQTTGSSMGLHFIQSNTLYIPEGDGITRPLTCRELLESICVTYNARLMFADGVYRFIPMGRLVDTQTSIPWNVVNYNGTAGTPITDITLDVPLSSSMHKLTGWQFTFDRPYKEVRRERYFYGNAAIVYDNIHNVITESTITDAGQTYYEDEVLKFSGTIRQTYAADGTSTGSARLGRALVRVTFKAGSKYLKRGYTFSGTAYDFQMQPGDVIEYTPGIAGAVSWESTASTYDILLPRFDRNAGAAGWSEIVQEIAVVAPDLPEDLDGLEVSVTLSDVSAAGALTNVTTEATFTCKIYDFGAYKVGDDNGDVLTYKAANTKGRDILDQPAVYIGDVTAGESIGRIRVNDGTNVIDSNSWRSLANPSATLALHRLGVQEVAGLYNGVTEGAIGTLYGDTMHPGNLLASGSDYYAAKRVKFIANERRTDVDLFLIAWSNTGTTTEAEAAKNIFPNQGSGSIGEGTPTDQTSGDPDSALVLNMFLNG
jgi:hypothetical protein